MTKPTKWHVRPAKTQVSLGIRPVWSVSSSCAQLVAKDLSFLHADSENWSDWEDESSKTTYHTIFKGGISLVNWASSRENLSLEFVTRVDSNRPSQLQRLASLNILDLANIDILPPRQRTTKVRIRLRRYAGRSPPLLFAYGINKQVFSWCGSNIT